MDNDEEDDESDDEDNCDEVMADDKKSDSSMPDPTTLKVLHYCIQRQCASASIIQRRFPIGFIRAVKIIDWMESMGYVASANSSTPGKMLLTQEKFTELYGQDNEDEKGVKRTAEFREGVGNLCGVLKRIADRKRLENLVKITRFFSFFSKCLYCGRRNAIDKFCHIFYNIIVKQVWETHR